MTSRTLSLLLFILISGLLYSQLPKVGQLYDATQQLEVKESVADNTEISQQTIATKTEEIPEITKIDKRSEDTEVPQTVLISDIKPEQIQKPKPVSLPKIKNKVKTTVVNNNDIPNFAKIKDVKQKKSTFFSFMNNKIIPANKKVAAERETLLQLLQKFDTKKIFSKTENSTFTKLSKKYRVDKNGYSISQKLQRLKQKINKIPPSLILAQSANESAWGTSRFARKGNNYFGQWCYSKGCGLVPASRNEGSTHEVAKFSSVQKSVEEYIYNINVGRSYKKIRQLREKMNNKQQAVDSLVLATGLEKYSERGKKYVEEIQSMIRFNKLKEYDKEY